MPAEEGDARHLQGLLGTPPGHCLACSSDMPASRRWAGQALKEPSAAERAG